ncbi:helicase [Fibrobacteria bacterium R8-3-H12]
MTKKSAISFEQILQKYREQSFSERDKGYRFERLMQSFLKTLPEYADYFTKIWLWNEFPSRGDFGSGDKDLGIDLVAKTKYGDYWAVQCKCYQEDAVIDKPKLDTFLATSGKTFYDITEVGKKAGFACRLWIDTTIKGFNREAESTIQNQIPEVKRIGYYDLVNALVDWQKIYEGLSGSKASVKKYDLRPHQQTAVAKVHEYLKTNDRGKLIMACGTGKTFTSLRIAEKETAKDGGLVLFLVPSIALLGQTLREWKAQCTKPIHAICICSDAAVSKSSKNEEDTNQISLTDLCLPASTDIKNIKKQIENARLSQKTEGGNIVVFSTYQSIDVISEVQKTFDLVICDEAHRTTGITAFGKEEAAFVKVHNDKFIKAKKRIYMTATPRLYSDDAQKKARDNNAVLCSMDDVAMYGDEMYRIGFGESVDKNLLSDYKVIIFTIKENQLNEKIGNSIDEKNKEINVEDRLKIIGCINALSKKSLSDKELFEAVDPAPMHSAVAFCQNIAISKATAEAFNVCRDAYFGTLSEKERREMVSVEAEHIDGTMGAQLREQKLHWLKSADHSKRECKILHNVRCLSEGVDVPSLDAVMFLSARNSQIDVVQSVGRVMRKAEGKKYGYIIIPVVVLPNADPDKTLSSDNFKVVWTVLNALRAHDDRFNATINKIELNKKKSGKINVIGFGEDSAANESHEGAFQKQLELEFAELQGQIYAKIVLKCGTKPYWEQWAADVAKIAEQHIENIAGMVKKKGTAKDEFEKYLNGLRKNINPAVTEQEAIEMLAQHIITKPVFEALFEDYSFVKNNVVSKSLQGIIAALDEKNKKEDTEKLMEFHKEVKTRAGGIDNSEGRQKIIVELYDKFFRTAFPKVTEKLGIVYTPVEIVDFIVRSVEDVLQKEFGRSMSDENVHILDPFTGTGTFITRLLQSGIIKPGDLPRKYEKEIHANEIVLLAYYIASINIENVYHDLQGQAEKIIEFPVERENYSGLMAADSKTPVWKVPVNSYKAFPGICLTDTFQLGESEEFIKHGFLQNESYFRENSAQVLKQKQSPLRIIFGNPPYSIGQKSANDNAQNQSYPNLEKRIAESYVENSAANLNKAAYDAYIKAFRWASDRLDKNGGIIAFVSNGSWLDNNGLDGFRKSIEKEFDKIYIFNLRGNCRTSGELRQKEAGNIFGLGSRTPIAVTMLVRHKREEK